MRAAAPLLVLLAASAQAPAQEAGVQPNDIIDQVEMTAAGGHRAVWAATRAKDPAAEKTERELDPLRLPEEMRQWADGRARHASVARTLKKT